MKIKFNGLIFTVVLLLGIGSIVSCQFGFESKRYYNRRRANTEVPQEWGDVGDPPAADEDDIQALFDDAETHKDEPFPASNFDDWVFYMTAMDGNSVGTFKFSNSGTWTDQGSYQTYVSGIDVGSGLKKAWNLCYYRYKSREARWQDSNGFIPFNSENDPDGKLAKREERFLFFKFTGDAAMNTKLNNSMVCVDTYTKFIWNYSEPGILKNIAGNAVPTNWVDYEEPNLTSDHTQIFAKFYMYDPVGYVTKSGDVVMYDWAKPLIKPGDYRPRQEYETIAEHNPNKPGHSPYLPSDSIPANTTVAADGTIKVKAISLKNINMGDQSSSVPSGTIAVFGHRIDIILPTETKQIARTTKIGEGVLASFMHTLVHGVKTSSLWDGTVLQPTIKHAISNSDDAKISLKIDLRVYTRNGGLLKIKTTDEELLIKPEAKFNFGYDSATNSIVCLGHDAGLGDGVTVTGYDGFSVKKGKSKDLVLVIEKDGRTAELRFKISFIP